MAWIREDSCVGCAECIGCWRRNHYTMNCYCDNCGAEIGDIGYHDGELELCSSCAAEAMFCANVPEDRRGYVRQCMATEGYDTSVIDDVIEWFDIPEADQLDCFDAVDYNPDN